MQLTCRRCQGSFSVPGTTTMPCPACGSIDVAARSPMAATTERPAGSFSAPVSQPVAAPPSAMAPYGQAPLAQAPSYPAPPMHGPMHAPHVGQPMPQSLGGPYPQAGPQMGPPMPQHMVPQPYSYAQPVHVVIQNQIPVAPVPYAMVPYARRKDAGVAALLSFFLPGAGQLYNGQTGKGVAFLLVSLFVNLPLMLVGIGFVTGLVTWIWAMVDAHGSAEKINRGEIVV